MASPTTIRTNLGTRLRSISGLQVYDRWPAVGNLNLPCAVIDMTGSEPEQTFGRGDLTRWDFQLYVLTGTAGGVDQAQKAIDPFLATSSTGGVFGAIAADRTLGGAVDTVFVRGTRDYGLIDLPNTDLMLQGAVIDLEMWAS